jgi:6-pyruvoyltetrahydropterin/6-carboxytetrahydropterin synthase
MQAMRNDDLKKWGEITTMAISDAVRRIRQLENELHSRFPPHSITRSYTFEAAHALTHLPADHKCHNLHGHSYKVEVSVNKPIGGGGMVMDFAKLDAIINPIIKELDHSNLNDKFDFFTTSENLAQWLFEKINKGTVAALRVGWVSVSETERSKAIYDGYARQS